MFDRVLLWSHLALGFFFLVRFLITASILVLIIGLFIISVSCWFSLGRLNFSKNLSISSRLSILLPYSFSLWCLIILCISALSVATSPFSFLILLIWFYFSWWVWLKVCQFYLLKEPAFSFIKLYYCFFHFFFIYFCSDHLISFLLLIFRFFYSFSSCFRCKVRLSIRCFSCFFW